MFSFVVVSFSLSYVKTGLQRGIVFIQLHHGHIDRVTLSNIVDSLQNYLYSVENTST